MSDVEQVDEEDAQVDLPSSNGNVGRLSTTTPINQRRCCVNATLQLALSTPGLVVLVVVYSVLGALIFPLLEAPAEVQMAATVSNSRDECLKELWTITERLNVLYERNWTMLVHEQLRRFEGSIVAATKGGLADTLGEQWPRWTFSEALLYSVTVITTIGHGNLTPRTSEGKVATMLYALVGVPLMLMCLSSLGGFLAEALQCSYGRLCGAGAETSNGGGRGRLRDGTGEIHVNNCQLAENETDCTFCNNFEAVCAEKQANIMQSFDKHNNALCEREDSCRLIHHSPIKSIMSSKLSNGPSSNLNHSTLAACCTLPNSPKHLPCNGLRPSSDPPPPPSQQEPFPPSSPLLERNAAPPNTRTINVYFPVNNRMQQMVNSASHKLPPQLLHLHQSHQMMALHQTMPLPPAGFAGHTVMMQQQMAPPPPPSNYHHQQTVQIPVNNGLLPTNEFQRLVLQQHQQQQPQASPLHTATVHGLGRSKFQPKPLPPEINVLMADCESAAANNCGNHHHHHHHPHQQHDSSSSSSSSAAANNESTTTTAATATPPKCAGVVVVAAAASLETLDDDDDDDNRNGCQHGTPSRIPLIKANPKQPASDISTRRHANRTSSSGEYQSVNQHENDTTDSSLGSIGHSPQVPITVILIILIGYIAIGTAIFSLWENWSIIDGAYFCFVTLSTIGFGDLVPQKTFHGPDIQLFACCAYLVLGLVLVAMSFSLLETQLLWKCRRMAVRLKLTSD